IGTCSKALGAQGGFIVADAPIIEWIVNKGRSFIFSTAPVPAAVGAAIGSLDLLNKQPELPEQLRQRAAELRSGLQQLGWQVPDGRSPIIPLIVGQEQAALQLAAQLRAAGHYAPAIRPPTVPAGSCRLRLTITLAHKASDWKRLLRSLAALAP
ncbi:MAG: aminotransferase class I/II-fold pyridoxal phosphate-dependent enzyme, partial [Planctomycetota bacterium]